MYVLGFEGDVEISLCDLHAPVKRHRSTAHGRGGSDEPEGWIHGEPYAEKEDLWRGAREV